MTVERDDNYWDEKLRLIAARAQAHYEQQCQERRQRRWQRVRRVIDRLLMLVALAGSLIDIAYNLVRRRWRTLSR